ncbi:hypothetical protein SDC9_160600 [bioreactor metagenome]|uniref:Uncharacterized protein n=1 Tax=bioreactor metagenome TaxID=1076179 RepID=A0A645FIV4_9ZZZZ
MRRASDQHLRPQHRPGLLGGEVALSDVEHVGADEQCDVGPVVHREQPVVLGGDPAEQLQGRDLVTRLEALVPQLDDVHPTVVGSVQERLQVALLGAGVGAQVEPCGVQGRQPVGPDRRLGQGGGGPRRHHAPIVGEQFCGSPTR